MSQPYRSPNIELLAITILQRLVPKSLSVACHVNERYAKQTRHASRSNWEGSQDLWTLVLKRSKGINLQPCGIPITGPIKSRHVLQLVIPRADLLYAVLRGTKMLGLVLGACATGTGTTRPSSRLHRV